MLGSDDKTRRAPPISPALSAVLRASDGIAQQHMEVMPVKDVIAKDQTDAIFSYEFLSDQKCLSKALRPRLFCIRNTDAPLASIFQKHLKLGQIFRSGYYEDIANARQHEN